MQRFNSKKQKGFSILAVILVIVAVIAAIGIWALSGQINTSNSGSSSTDMQASTIINDAASIKLSYDRLIVSGYTSANITFIPNTVGANNMLDPSTGIQSPKVSSGVIKSSPGSTEGFWTYGNTFGLSGVGSASNDNIVMVAGIKKGVCERINNILRGSTALPTFGTATSAAATVGATAAAPTTTLTGTQGGNGWMTGCYTTTAGADDNVFVHVLEAN